MSEQIQRGRRSTKAPAKKRAVIVVEFEVLEDDPTPFDQLVDALASGLAARGLDSQVKHAWGAIDTAAEGIITVIREWRT